MPNMSTGFQVKLFACPQTRALITSFCLEPRSAFTLNVFQECSLPKMKLLSSSASWVLCSFSSSLSSITSRCTSSSSSSTIIAKYTTHDSFCFPLTVAIPPSIGNFMNMYRMLVATSKSYRTDRPRMAL